MWNFAQTSRRRRLVFDLLEGRRLLNGDTFRVPGEGIAPSGFPMRSAWVSGPDFARPGPAMFAHAEDLGAGVVPAFIDQRGHDSGWTDTDPDSPIVPGDGDRGEPAPGGTAFPGGSTESVSGGSGWAGQQSALPADMGASNPTGSPASELAMGSGLSAGSGAPSPGAGDAGSSASPFPMGGAPGELGADSHPQDPSSPPFSMISGAWIQSLMWSAIRENRLDLSSTGSMPIAPLETPVWAPPPSVQALTPLAANPGAPAVVTSQALPASPVIQAQVHSMFSDPDGMLGEHPGSLAMGLPARAEGRGAMDSGRAREDYGRAVVVATMLSQSSLSPSSDEAGRTDASLEEIAASPRGADLISEALPIAGESLERSLEEFVRQLETVDVSAIVTSGPTPLVFASMAVVGAAAAAVVVRGVVRRRSRRGGLRIVDSLGRELALSFPELPRSWSRRF